MNAQTTTHAPVYVEERKNPAYQANQLLLLQNYYDIALRDFGLSLGALALARVATYFEHPTAHQ